MDFFQNTCLKENDNNGGCKNLTVKQTLRMEWNKSFHQSKLHL